MQIEDFRLADCRLFRLPRVDFSRVQHVIENAVVNTWTKNGTAGAALDSLLSNEEIYNALAAQLRVSLGFQREQSLQNLEARKESRVEELTTERNQQISRLQRHYERRRSEAKGELDRANKVRQDRQRAIRAERERIAKLSSDVQQRLGTIGGSQGFQLLENMQLPGLESRADGRDPLAGGSSFLDDDGAALSDLQWFRALSDSGTDEIRADSADDSSTSLDPNGTKSTTKMEAAHAASESEADGPTARPDDEAAREGSGAEGPDAHAETARPSPEQAESRVTAEGREPTDRKRSAKDPVRPGSIRTGIGFSFPCNKDWWPS